MHAVTPCRTYRIEHAHYFKTERVQYNVRTSTHIRTRMNPSSRYLLTVSNTIILLYDCQRVMTIAMVLRCACLAIEFCVIKSRTPNNNHESLVYSTSSCSLLFVLLFAETTINHWEQMRTYVLYY